MHAFRAIAGVEMPTIPHTGDGRRDALDLERVEGAAQLLGIELGIASEFHLLDAYALAGIDVQMQIHFPAQERHDIVVHGGVAETVGTERLLGLIGDLMGAQLGDRGAFGKVHLQPKRGGFNLHCVEHILRHFHHVEVDRGAAVLGLGLHANVIEASGGPHAANIALDGADVERLAHLCLQFHRCGGAGDFHQFDRRRTGFRRGHRAFAEGHRGEQECR